MSYRLKYLINKLIMKAFLFPENDPRYKNPGKIIKKLTKAFLFPENDPRYKNPGKIIKKLTKEERELLKGAKSKDFYHRI